MLYKLQFGAAGLSLRRRPPTVQHRASTGLYLTGRAVEQGSARLSAAASRRACCTATAPKLSFPRRFRFCEICADGCGTVPCGICQGSGTTSTEPGGAGVSFYVGTARCRVCRGQGVLPCPLCAGYEGKMPAPNPDRPAVDFDAPEQLPEDDEDDGDYASWRRFGKVDIERAGHGW